MEISYLVYWPISEVKVVACDWSWFRVEDVVEYVKVCASEMY